jgi:hypothetical protein
MFAVVRRLAPALGVLALLTLGLAAAPAGAIVVKAEGVSAGLQPRSTTLFTGSVHPPSALNDTEPRQFANPAGNPVVPASKVYAVYWDPSNNHYHGDWQGWIDGFLQGVGAESGSFANVFAVAGQYTDAKNQHASYRTNYMGAYTDTEPYPSATCEDPQPLQGKSTPSGEPDAITCLTDQQVRAQLTHFIVRHTLQTGMETIFYVLTPPGVTVCLNGGGPTGHCSDYEYTSLESYQNSFCSYHSYINPDNAPSGDANTVLYAMIPWTAGGLGDGHLAAIDRTPAYDCQDGGYNPASEPIEQQEKKKEKTVKQEEEIKEKTKEEQAKIRQAEELEGPHQEEPNQPKGVGPDGTPDTGLVDLIINQLAVEQQNTITDPLLNGWQDPVGNEATDQCRNFFATASPINGSVTANEHTGAGTLSNQVVAGNNFYLNDAFNLSALKLAYPGVPCIPGIRFEPQFTAPNSANAGEIVGFNGMESDISLGWAAEYTPTETKPTYAFYSWNFGDGSPEVSGYAPGGPPVNPPTSLCEAPWRAPCAASVFHSYQYGGTYQVTLTAKDTGGNSVSVTHPVTVIGPAPPSSGGSPGGGSGAGSSGASPATAGSTPSATPGSSGHPAVPGPVATAAAVSNSLKQVARSGLVVHYTVNEQVAGRFEVLLAASTAHALGIGGHTATGLPAGFPKSLVIGQALLVTTKGGHSSVRIKFAKRIAKHLRRARTVTLTLRLKVRNASKSPLFTTVMSTVVLHR